MAQTRIILIGGTTGTGKTSLAQKIVQEYQGNHQLGTGFIREIVKTETKQPALACHTYMVSCENPYCHLAHQTDLMKQSINACIDRAIKEGTTLVIEGNHCLPWILENKNITSTVILYVEDDKKHLKMVNGNVYKHRNVSPDEFKRIREIQESLTHLAKINKVPLIEGGRDLEEVFDDVKKIIK